METMSNVATQILQSHGQHLSTRKPMQNALAQFKNPSNVVIENGVNALALLDSPPVSASTITKALIIIEQNFGAEVAKNKAELLFDMVTEDGWSEKRFDMTFKWFLKNKPYPSWTIADWFSYGVKLYPQQWYFEKCTQGRNVLKEMDRYKLADGVIGYKWKDGIELPLEKLPEPK